jgi:MFS family permease
MSTAMVMVGQMVGGVAFSTMMDRYGRHGVTSVCSIAMTACSIGLAFTNHFVLFVILRFLIGAFQKVMILDFINYHMYATRSTTRPLP